MQFFQSKALYAALFFFSLFSIGIQAQENTELSPQMAELKKLPSFLREGSFIYLQQGVNQAVNLWKNHYAPSRYKEEFSRVFRERMRELTNDSGDLIKVELIRERKITNSLRAYYLLFGYEDGVVFVRFDLYVGGEGLQIVGYKLDSDMTEVLPGYMEVAD